MRALLSRRPGGPETLTLEDWPAPAVGPGQVRVAVRACGINFPDFLVIQDLYQFKPERPFAPGAEVAGVVESVGEAVSAVKPGDRVVIAPIPQGGLAELATGSARQCWRIPDSMPFDEAAAFLMTYATSYHALKDRAQLKSAETLLVLGAGGGVGLAAVELGKAMGARVVAAASSESKLELARERGADEGVLYPRGALDKTAARALTERLKAVCGDGAQVIYDPVGGDYTEAALRAIAWQGRHLVVGFTAGIPKLPLNLTLLKGCAILGVFWGEFIRRERDLHAANVEELFALYAAGRIHPTVTERYPLERAAEAIARLGGREARGKIVVEMPR